MQIKKITASALSVLLVFLLAACGSNRTEAEPSTTTQQQTATEPAILAEEQEEAVQASDNTAAEAEQEDNTSQTNDILILYFSANNTKDADAVSSATPMPDGVSSVEWIADIIHENVGGDLVPIIPSVDYPLVYNDLADYAKVEADNEGRPLFEDLGVDPASYKTVFIGYPVWWYTVPKILETFFETYDLSGVTIIPFNTHAGSRDGGTWSLIAEREPNAEVLDGFTVAGDDTGKDETRAAVEQWLAGFQLN